MTEYLTDPGFVGRAVGTVISIALGVLVLVWPGPLSPTDRVPFALLFLLLGVVGASNVRRRLDSAS